MIGQVVKFNSKHSITHICYSAQYPFLDSGRALYVLFDLNINFTPDPYLLSPPAQIFL